VLSLGPGDPGARGRDEDDCEEVENCFWSGDGGIGVEDAEEEPPVRVDDGDVGMRW
jgi:hypothetical protein